MSPAERERKARVLAETISRTIKSGSIRAIEDLAAELARRGQKTASAELTKIAGAIRRSRAEQTAVEAAAAAAKVMSAVRPPATTIPMTVPPPVPDYEPAPAPEPEPAPAPAPEPDPITPPTENPARELARELTAHLEPGPLSGPVRRYLEDRSLVKRFQRAAGLVDDGLYGVGSGLAVAELGIVPARPFYFSRNAAKNRRDKIAWTERMQRYADQDQPRRERWLAAGKVSRL